MPWAITTPTAYRHSSRQEVFVGDLVDGGLQQLRVLETVKATDHDLGSDRGKGVGTFVGAVDEGPYPVPGLEQIVDGRHAGGSSNAGDEKRRHISAFRYDRVKARFSTGPDNAALTWMDRSSTNTSDAPASRPSMMRRATSAGASLGALMPSVILVSMYPT